MAHDATAATLISESVRETRCVRAEYREDLNESLLVECEDSQDEPQGPDSDAVTRHYWGTTETGAEWSVRLRNAR